MVGRGTPGQVWMAQMGCSVDCSRGLVGSRGAS